MPANPFGRKEAGMTSQNGKNEGRRALAAALALMLTLSITAAAAGALPPVETRQANAPYAPAFDGQTRAPGMRTQTPYRVQILSDELDAPWAVTALPDGRLAITQKGGTMRLYAEESGLGGVISGFPPVEDGGQGGLLDVAPAPDYPQSRVLYFTLAERTQGGSLTAVGRGRLSEDETRILDFEILYRALPANQTAAHYGSRLLFGPDGFLYVTAGDRQSAANRVKAQEKGSAWGKVLRLTAQGLPAPGNPFEGMAGALDEVYTLGHRNPQSLDLHPESGEIWLGEMGPRGGDELNLLLAGANYGWPEVSYGIEYSGAPVGRGQAAAPGTEQPKYYWDPVLAPGGMAFYTGDAIPEWKNDLFIGGLASRHISRLKLDGTRVAGEERLLESEGQRFRDVADGGDGALYAVTDEGRLYRIGP